MNEGCIGKTSYDNLKIIFDKKTFNSSIMFLGRQDTQRSDIQHNNTQHYLPYKPQSALQYAERHIIIIILNVILHFLFIVTLRAKMLSVVLLNDIKQNDTHHNGLNCDTEHNVMPSVTFLLLCWMS